jgi:hypothetical protein
MENHQGREISHTRNQAHELQPRFIQHYDFPVWTLKNGHVQDRFLLARRLYKMYPFLARKSCMRSLKRIRKAPIFLSLNFFLNSADSPNFRHHHFAS